MQFRVMVFGAAGTSTEAPGIIWIGAGWSIAIEGRMVTFLPEDAFLGQATGELFQTPNAGTNGLQVHLRFRA
jgi:hypothetical protein